VNVNPITGEVVEEETFPGTDTHLVPLNLGSLNEDELLALFPTPAQAAGALLKARDVNGRAPAALARFREALLKAEGELRIAIALGAEELLTIYPRMSMTERRSLALAINDRAKKAQDDRDTAYLQMEYARDFERAIGRDIEILRSLNANLRTEHRG
jgi:hypothetical protein